MDICCSLFFHIKPSDVKIKPYLCTVKILDIVLCVISVLIGFPVPTFFHLALGAMACITFVKNNLGGYSMETKIFNSKPVLNIVGLWSAGLMGATRFGTE